MNYEIKDNPVHGKLLAKNGKVVMLPHDQAMALADRFNGTLLKSVTGANMVQLPQTANSIAECDCQQSGTIPDIIDFRMGRPRNKEPDHEVRMARQELYRTAKLAMMTHELLKQVSEQQGIEGWVASKLTRAADYIETVFDYLDYEMRYPSEMMEAPIQPVAPVAPVASVPGQQSQQAQQAQQQAQHINKVPGMVKMAKVDTNGKIQGQPIMVSGTQVASKQAAGYHVIGESASGGASGAGGVATSTGFGNGFLNGGPGAITRRPKKKKTTEAWDMLDPSKPYGLANPRIMRVGDDPQGIADFAIIGKNVLSIYPFNANQWNNIQQDARNHGYMLKYTGTNPKKAMVANTGDAPRLGYNMRGDKLAEAKAVKQRLDAKCWTGKHKEGTKIKGGVRVNNCVPNEGVEEVELDEVSSALLNRYRDAAKTSDTSGMSKTKQLKRSEQLPNLAQAKVAAGKSDDDSRYTLNRYKMTGGKVKVPATEEVQHVEDGVEEEKAGLYANVQAKRERIKHGSGEHMRKPGTKGAPTSQSWKDAAKTAKTEAANPAQQAAIAIAKKKEKGVKEGETGPKFTGYWKGTDKGKPGSKMVGDA